MTDAPVRFGLIGFGAWGECHANAMRSTRGADLISIAVKSETTYRRACEAFPDAAVVKDYRQLLSNSEIEVVHVVVPSYLHFEIASAVLRAGKHLLLEKPMCLSLEHCQELIDLAKKNKLLLAIGHELRLSSLWSKAKELIDQGAIGDPQYVLVELSRKPYRLGADGWRYDIERVGSWILEEPIHFFDFARWYMESAGDPVSIFATANSRQAEHPELQDNFSAIVNFSGGEYAVVSQSLSMFEHHQTVKVAGTGGSLWAQWSGGTDRTLHPTFSLKVANNDRVHDIPIEKITGEVYELEDQVAMLVQAIRHNGKLMASGEDGKWSVAMCLAAQQAVAQGSPVAMSDWI